MVERQQPVQAVQVVVQDHTGRMWTDPQAAAPAPGLRPPPWVTASGTPTAQPGGLLPDRTTDGADAQPADTIADPTDLPDHGPDDDQTGDPEAPPVNDDV